MHRQEVQEPGETLAGTESLKEDLGSKMLWEQNQSARGLAVALPGW